MTHFVRILRENGPLIHYWSMRYESKHRQLKLSAVSTSSKRNLLKTLSIKSLLQLGYLRLTKNVSSDDIEFKRHTELDIIGRKKWFPNIDLNITILEVNNVEVNEIKYSLNLVLVLNISEGSLKFGKIIRIFIVNKQVFVLINPLVVNYFDEDYFAYQVEEFNICILKNIKELPDVQPCLLCRKTDDSCIGSSYFVTTKHAL